MNLTDSWPQTHDQIILSKFTAPNQEAWGENACIKNWQNGALFVQRTHLM